MSISELSKTAHISQSELHGIIVHYIEQRYSEDEATEMTLKEKLASDELFRERAEQCVREAIVYSTMVVGLRDDEDFYDALRATTTTEDELLNAMRRDIFVDSIECATEATIECDSDVQIINRRSLDVIAAFQGAA